MLTLDEARARLLDALPRPETARVPLDDAAGRVLTADVVSPTDLPPHDHSAMDGWAATLDDLGATRPAGDTVFAGDVTPRAHRPGFATRIFTGAVVPDGATLVVAQEHCEARDGFVTLPAQSKPGANIRRRGEDLRAGSRALAAGTRLGAQHLGLLAAFDMADVTVARAPRVRVITTGDELRAPGAPRAHGQVVDAVSPMLRALARRAAAEVTLARAPDDLDALTAALRDALDQADLVVTVGGVSVGDRDHVRAALGALGAPLDFWQVALRPGRPLAAARAGRSRVLAVPGNPAAAFVTFALFGMPLLRALQGDRAPTPAPLPARLEGAMSTSAGRLTVARGSLRATPEGMRVAVEGNQSAGALPSLAGCDALALAAGDGAPLAEGSAVDVVPLDAL